MYLLLLLFNDKLFQEDGKLNFKVNYSIDENIVDVVTPSKKEKNIPTVIDDPLQHDDYFNVRSLVTLEDLFKNRAHHGHVTGMRNPWMSQYIYGHRLDVDIIHLDKTLPMLYSALNFLAYIAYRQGIILSLTRYPAHVPLVERAARDCGEYAHCRKWAY
ncbi:unnamed protein product [Rotaria sp. Silwood2]|nr:unnamed protein product [Rotaria sp. Silwood2]